jgi:hypothetical protein
LDLLGVITSAGCAIHCALGPLLVGVSGVASSLVEDERIEMVLLLSAVVVAVIAAALGHRRHGDRWVVSLVMVGLSLVGIAHFFEPSGVPEPVYPVLAAVVLIAAHVRNARALLRHRACCSGATCSTVEPR